MGMESTENPLLCVSFQILQILQILLQTSRTRLPLATERVLCSELAQDFSYSSVLLVPIETAENATCGNGNARAGG